MCAALVAFILLSFAFTARSAVAASPHVDVMMLNGDINPASQQFLTNTLHTAENDGARALVIEIDTPGGDIDSMKAMTQAELSSTIPVIAYVAPTGGRAASAGALVTLAAQVAVMAPTTRIGASSPISSTGSNLDSTLESKIEQDLLSGLRGMQQRYGRQYDPAALMVTQAKSYDDSEARSLQIVDCADPYSDAVAQSQHLPCDTAASLSALLNQVNGRQVTLESGQTVTLQTAGIAMQTISASPYLAIYNFLIDPNVVFLLFIVAVIGIFLEISHPGAIVPGVTGSIALLLFLLAVGSLSPNWVGLALMVLAFVMLVLDVKIPTHGVLTLGAVISLGIGALIFFNSGGPYQGPQINPLVVYAMAGLMGVLGLAIVTFVVRTRKRPVNTGIEGMIGATAITLTPLLPEGRVSFGGEDWAAVLDPPITSLDPGSEVRIVAVEGLRLHVRPVVNTISTSSPKYIRGS
jgi:membrane-bound serine protease (ClpP class)